MQFKHKHKNYKRETTNNANFTEKTKKMILDLRNWKNYVHSLSEHPVKQLDF